MTNKEDNPGGGYAGAVGTSLEVMLHSSPLRRKPHGWRQPPHRASDPRQVWCRTSATAVRAAEEGGCAVASARQLVCLVVGVARAALRDLVRIADRLRFVDSRGITTSCATWVLNYLATDPQSDRG